MVIIGNLLSFPTQSLLCFLFCLSSKPLHISDINLCSSLNHIIGINLDSHLTDVEKAQSIAFRIMTEESLN